MSSILKSIGGKAAKEAAEKAAKEAAEKAVKEAAEKAAKEAAEKAIKEAAEKAIKEAAQKSIKEASEKSVKEAAEKTVKETGEKSIKKAAIGAAAVGTAGLAAYTFIDPLVEMNRKNSTTYSITNIEDISSLFETTSSARISISPGEKISSQDTITISESDSRPSVDGSYKPSNIISDAQFDILIPSQILTNGTQGKMTIKTEYETQLAQTTQAGASAVGQLVGNVGGTVLGGLGGGLLQGLGLGIDSIYIWIIIVVIVILMSSSSMVALQI